MVKLEQSTINGEEAARYIIDILIDNVGTCHDQFKAVMKSRD